MQRFYRRWVFGRSCLQDRGLGHPRPLVTGQRPAKSLLAEPSVTPLEVDDAVVELFVDDWLDRRDEWSRAGRSA